MARKQYLAIHRYHSDEVKKQFLTPPPQQDWQTDLEWAQGRTFEKAKCLGYWVGNDDFFFCHWEAEDEQNIHDALSKMGLNEFIVTACYRAHDHVHTNNLTGNLCNSGPWKD